MCHDAQRKLKSAGMNRIRVPTELPIGQEGSHEGRMIILQQHHTLRFRLFANRNYYNALITKSFSSLDCNWLGQIYDCCLMRPKSLNDPYLPLCGSFHFHEFFDSDEDGNVSFDDNDTAGSGNNDQQYPDFDYDDTFEELYETYPVREVKIFQE